MKHMTLYPKSTDRQTDMGKTHDAQLKRCRQYSLQSYLKEILGNIFRFGGRGVIMVGGCMGFKLWEGISKFHKSRLHGSDKD